MWDLIGGLTGGPLVRDCDFFRFKGCFKVMRVLGVSMVLVDEDLR